jgi:hypothetical protein
MEIFEIIMSIIKNFFGILLSLIKDSPIYLFIKNNLPLVVAVTSIIVTLFIFAAIRDIKQKVLAKRFRRFGFYNKDGETPKRIRTWRNKERKRDKSKKHSIIHEYDNVGIPTSVWSDNTESLTIALKSQIGFIDISKNVNRTIVETIPWKYATPEIISIYDKHYIENFINVLVVGRSGSGKTYSLLTFLGMFARQIPNVSISVFERKPSLAQFTDTPNYFSGKNVADGLRKFYECEFLPRLEMSVEERKRQPLKVILIDEYSALITAQRDKKIADELRAIVGELLSTSRELRILVMVGIQRADNEYFKAGARDQFKAILAMGNLSKEQKSMIINDDKEKMTARNKVGEGYYSVDGQEIKRVKIQEIKNREFVELNEIISKAMHC